MAHSAWKYVGKLSDSLRGFLQQQLEFSKHKSELVRADSYSRDCLVNGLNMASNWNTLSDAGFAEFTKKEFKCHQNLISDGTEGNVYLEEHPTHGRIAVKIFKQTALNNHKREIENLAKHTFHKNMVRFFGYVFKGTIGNSSIVGFAMEYLPMSLEKVIHGQPRIEYSTLQLLDWGSQATLALAWLHSRNVIHRDVKPGNMLLSKDMEELKICDLGFTREECSDMTKDVGTQKYMAPELSYGNTKNYTNACDVFSIGVCLIEMDTRERLLFKKYGLEKLIWIKEGKPINIDGVTEVLTEIIKGCLHHDPSSRLTMSQLNKELNLAFKNYHLKSEPEQKSDNLTVDEVPSLLREETLNDFPSDAELVIDPIRVPLASNLPVEAAAEVRTIVSPPTPIGPAPRVMSNPIVDAGPLIYSPWTDVRYNIGNSLNGKSGVNQKRIEQETDCTLDIDIDDLAGKIRYRVGGKNENIMHKGLLAVIAHLSKMYKTQKPVFDQFLCGMNNLSGQQLIEFQRYYNVSLVIAKRDDGSILEAIVWAFCRNTLGNAMSELEKICL